jgi:hypothetical protein
MWPSSLALEEGIRMGFGGRGWRFFGQYEFVVPIIEGDTEWYGTNFKVGITARIGDQLRMDVKKK